MFLRWYRKKIAEAVEDKMDYLRTCPNERDMILNIIAPKDYKKLLESHCGIDCWKKNCKCYYREENKTEDK